MAKVFKNSIERVDKPWGHELIWAKTKDYVGKVLVIKKGHKLSLQYHREKEETLFLAKGTMVLVLESEVGSLTETTVHAGEAYHVPPGAKHRMVAVEDCEVFEVSTPQLSDVVRLDDHYGRST